VHAAQQWKGNQGPLVGSLATRVALPASQEGLLLLLVLLRRAGVGTLEHLARPGAHLVLAEASLCRASRAAGGDVMEEENGCVLAGACLCWRYTRQLVQHTADLGWLSCCCCTP
jgi:hypothetical protein